MLISKYFLLLSFLILGSVKSDETENVEVLKDSTFDDFIENNEFILVMFHAPWCGHCKAFTPIFEETANLLKSAGSNIRLAKIDATENPIQSTKYEVKGYPTVIFFKNGVSRPYTGSRNAEAMVKWVKSKSRPEYTKVENLSQLKELRNSSEIFVVGYFTENSVASLVFQNASLSTDDIVFAIVEDPALAKEISLTEDSIVLNLGDQDPIILTKDEITSVDSMKKWIQAYIFDPVVNFTQSTAQVVISGSIKHVHFLIASRTSQEFSTLYSQFEDAAKKFLTKVVFSFIDADKEESFNLVEYLGVTKDDIPANRIVSTSGSIRKYKPSPDDSYESFTNSYLDGKATIHLQSEPLPSDWNSTSILYLVSSNFKEIVFGDANVLVYFYTKWCEPCMEFLKEFEKLPAHFDDEENVVITRMDITKNELLEFTIDTVPVVKFYPPGSSEGIMYNGKKSIDDLREFIKTEIEKAQSKNEKENEENTKVHEEL